MIEKFANIEVIMTALDHPKWLWEIKSEDLIETLDYGVGEDKEAAWSKAVRAKRFIQTHGIVQR